MFINFVNLNGGRSEQELYDKENRVSISIACEVKQVRLYPILNDTVKTWEVFIETGCSANPIMHFTDHEKALNCYNSILYFVNSGVSGIRVDAIEYGAI